MQSTTTIRVAMQTRDLLQALAQRSGVSMQSVLEDALEHYRRQQLLDAMNAAYAALHTDADAWAAVEDERRMWDHTLADGLEDA
ncbi:MAG: toxin-antitoxin system protein [Roseiflexaceae bacterium]